LRTVLGGYVALMLLAAPCCRAEDGSAAWLRYAPVNAERYKSLPPRIVVAGNSEVERTAGQELARGLSSMLHREFTVSHLDNPSNEPATQAIVLSLETPREQTEGHSLLDSYTIQLSAQQETVRITGATPAAELYGAFRLLELVGAEQAIPAVEKSTAAVAVRWSDEWDNLDGSIERGFAGPSIFFERGHVRQDLGRVSAYGRLLGSIGINGCDINNVNADLDLLTSEHLKEFARIADAFRPWGVKLALSVDITSPQTVGGLGTFDPLDPLVIAWWKNKTDEIYALIPDFGGFTVKADSEGRKGPSQYGRSPADAANVLARALAPHQGVVLYRGFVYDNHLDWRDPKADRARAGVDNFAKLDGKFEPNVIIQIKEGPIDFQAREPVSPLFATMPRSNVAIELQTSQEYTGQQRHMVWLPSMWKWVLDTDMKVNDRYTPVSQIVEGKTFPSTSAIPKLGGFISVSNVGMDANWLHHPMAMANLYGFGRLAWNPNRPLREIVDTWSRLTWSNNARVDSTIDELQLNSWKVYEGYTGPNGMGTLTNITGPHYGPGIESAERNGWGQWFRADADGIGMDRTAVGTGYVQQYPPALAAEYNSLSTCPDDLLLFFHHVPYDYRLHSGKTLIQSIYDTHYASAREAGEYEGRWLALKGQVDDERFDQVLALFRYQAGHAIVWRDAIVTWFYRMSHIPDRLHRVDHDPNRIEAESMTADGYESIDVTPAETASGGKAMACHAEAGCSLSTVLHRAAGSYDIAVQYFDTWRGVSKFQLLVNDKEVAAWKADDTLPPARFDPMPDGETSTRFTAHNVHLQPGDKLTVRGIPDLRSELIVQPPQPTASSPTGRGPRGPVDYREFAMVDYVELGPAGPLTPQ
jgi:alpha-glucuronidase